LWVKISVKGGGTKRERLPSREGKVTHLK